MNIAPPITPENLDLLAPYIAGFARVSLGDVHGFRADEPLVQFSWFEEGKFNSLPWLEAVQRFGKER